MSAATTAERLWREGYDLSQKRTAMDQAEFNRLAIWKANEIRDFLGVEGPILDQSRPDLIDGLGKAYDVLVKGAAETLQYVMPNPTWSGIKHLGSGAATAEVLDQAADKAADYTLAVVRKWRPWLIGSAVVLLSALGLYAYSTRRSK
jgi:hypothetical protein